MSKFLSPVGRLVQGSFFKFSTKSKTGQPLVYKDGSPRVQYYAALAFDKKNPKTKEFVKQLQDIGNAAWPNNGTKKKDFAWKFVDGDHEDHKNKTGFAGHIVVKFTTGYAPALFTKGAAAKITDEKAVKCGDFFRIAGTSVSNKSSDKPGMIHNMKQVEHVGYGEEIIGGATGEEFKESEPDYIPEGMSSAPVATSDFTPPPAEEPEQDADWGFLS
jgi:hypothetical protein